MKNYLRTFTALLPKEFEKHIKNEHVALHVRNYLFIFLVILAGILLQLLVILNGKYVVARENYVEKEKNYAYWKSVASQFPNIPDILYNTSLSALELGKKEEAVIYVDKALTIDSLFKKAIVLKEVVLQEQE